MLGETLRKAATLQPFTASLTYDGVSNLIQDYVAKYGSKPKAIVLSYRDRRNLNQDTMDHSITPVARDDANKDDMAIAFVQGVLVGWNRDVRDGHAVIIPKEQHTAQAH